MTESAPATAGFGGPITVVGAESLTLDETTVSSFEYESQAVEVVCASGHRYTAEWTGIGVDALCDAVDASPGTTHVVVESRDGYRIAVPVLAGLSGMVAFFKDGRPVGETNPYPNRFVSPDVDGDRDVKGVSRVEFHALASTEDPDALEQVEPDDDRFEADRD